LVVLVVLLSACGGGSSTPDPETANQANTETAAEADTETAAEADTETAAEANTEANAETETETASQTATRPVPCPPRADWPEGMACVLGGTFDLGDPDGRPEEQTPGEVYVDTFYMDLTEVTNEAYEGCIEAGQCERPMPFRRFGGPRQPLVAVSWFDAVHHCEMLGKRLPTEAEWERGAAGPDDTRFPWGDEPLGCERASIKDAQGEGCGREITSPVASYPAGHWGLFDMAGNVHEWVQDRYSDCLRGCDNECGDACFGDNPKGPCGGGLDRCPGHGLRSVRGGSWFWPLERARAQARRGSGAPNRGPHRFGFRCARDLL
jgi:formylglycine-generating enzyme required for sulfatase activity